MASKTVYDLDHLLESSGKELIQSYKGSKAIDERIQEWMETPVGTLMDNPSWGNSLNVFKFMPQSVDLEVMLESHIVSKLPRDIMNLDIRGIKASFVDIDILSVVILSEIGVFQAEVKVGEEND
jgi:hypothetical protein